MYRNASLVNSSNFVSRNTHVFGSISVSQPQTLTWNKETEDSLFIRVVNIMQRNLLILFLIDNYTSLLTPNKVENSKLTVERNKLDGMMKNDTADSTV